MIDAYLRARVRTRVVYNLVAVTIDSSLSLLLSGIADLLTIMINQLVRNERLEFAAFAKGPRFRELRSRRIVQYTNKRNIH